MDETTTGCDANYSLSCVFVPFLPPKSFVLTSYYWQIMLYFGAHWWERKSKKTMHVLLILNSFIIIVKCMNFGCNSNTTLTNNCFWSIISTIVVVALVLGATVFPIHRSLHQVYYQTASLLSAPE
jgi:hypothetical protein